MKTVMTPEFNLRELPSPLLIIGSAYTGKSALAIKALSQDIAAAVVGTADVKEPSFHDRIATLKGLRPSSWIHIDCPDDLNHLLRDLQSQKVPQLLVDSINQWVAGIVLEGSSHHSLDQLEQIIEREGEALCQYLRNRPTCRVVLVSSEVGAGVTPPQPLPRLFRQATSRLNCQLAEACASVVMVSAGIPILIKGGL